MTRPTSQRPATEQNDVLSPSVEPMQLGNPCCATYAALIALAITRAPEQRLILKDIYGFVDQNRHLVPVLHHPNWKNSVRHNLSLRPCFVKNQRVVDGKNIGALWSVDKTCLPQVARQAVELFESLGQPCDISIDVIFARIAPAVQPSSVRSAQRRRAASAPARYSPVEVRALPARRTRVRNRSVTSAADSGCSSDSAPSSPSSHTGPTAAAAAAAQSDDAMDGAVLQDFFDMTLNEPNPQQLFPAVELPSTVCAAATDALGLEDVAYFAPTFSLEEIEALVGPC